MTPEKKAAVNAALQWLPRWPNRKKGRAKTASFRVHPKASMICPISSPRAINSIKRVSGHRSLAKICWKTISLTKTRPPQSKRPEIVNEISNDPVIDLLETFKFSTYSVQG